MDSSGKGGSFGQNITTCPECGADLKVEDGDGYTDLPKHLRTECEETGSEGNNVSIQTQVEKDG